VAWSTRELADLAGTTVRAVRHYHDVGLLEEPRRCSNGYKQYGVAHLIRTLDRLQDVRTEVHQILQQAAPTDLPPALATRIRDIDLSDADRALLVVLTRVLDLAAVTDFVDTLHGLPQNPAATAFDELPADADAATRHELSIRLLPPSRTLRVMLPRLRQAATGLSAAAARTLDEAVRDLHNPAQFDVLRRVGLLLSSRPGPVRAPQADVAPRVEITVRTGRRAGPGALPPPEPVPARGRR
jgi:DNA-binding transcriptional MerR regulator